LLHTEFHSSSGKDIRSRKRGQNDYGQSWMVASALEEGPKTIEELAGYYRILGRRFGFFIGMRDGGDGGTKMRRNLERTVTILLNKGWAVRKEGRYHITEEGRREAGRMIRDLERSGRFLEKATRPASVSRVTLVVHFLLAAAKLPAALISGSVGLLNDALDTLMDGISSVFVYLGIRSGRERLVTHILLGFMGITGLYTLYEALTRLVSPEPLKADWVAFAAVAVSAVVCTGLWIYQKYSGLKHGSVPLIAQALDSRNHVIVAVGVSAGLAAAALRCPRLDGVVGVLVAVLILKGAGELLAELLRSQGDDEIDFGKYGFTLLGKHRRRRLRCWLLYEIASGRVADREQMIMEARAATDYSRIASLRALGLDTLEGHDEKLSQAVHEIFSMGLVEEIPRKEGRSGLALTPKGKEELNRCLPGSGAGLSGAAGPTWRPDMIRIIAGVAGFALWLAVFTAVCVTGRWLLGFLPPLEIFSAADAVPFFRESDFFLRIQRLAMGRLGMTIPQALLALAGLVTGYRGWICMHRASHAVRHARDRDSGKPHYLVTDGVFSKRRHPLYTGLVWINLAMALAMYSIYPLVWAGLVLLIQTISIRREERKLSAWFPRAYPDYCRRVKRKMFSRMEWLILAGLFIVAGLGA